MSVLDKAPPSASRHRAVVRALLLSTALTSVGGAAFAADKSKETATAAAAPAPAAASTGLGEVVVTARKRSEDLQTTPVSVTAVSAAQVQNLNIRNFQDLRGAVPNLEVTPMLSGGVNLAIRGIGQSSAQVNVDAKSGLYVNEVYIARSEGNQLYFYDVESVQVLKGPQGTLFGKNTTAGAFLLTTAKPTSDPGGFLDVRAGSYRKLDTEGAINMPFNDKLMGRFSFQTHSTDGYIHHVLDQGVSNNINDKSARFQIRALASDKFTVDFLAEYNESNTDGLTSIETGCRNNASYTTKYNLLHSKSYCATYPSLSAHYTVYGGATLSIPTSSALTDVAKGGDYTPGGLTREGHPGPFNTTKVSTANLRLNYELTDDISLKSITGYRRSWTSFYNPTLNAPNDIYAEFDKTPTSEFTEEVNLNGKALGSRLTYTAGGYYYKQKTYFLQDTGPDWIDPTGYTYSANNDFTSYAAYAQASYKIIDPLELTVGARYSYDKKAANSVLNFQNRFSGADCGTTTVGGVTTDYFVNAFRTGQACNGLFQGKGSNSWDSFDPKAQLSYQFNRDIYAYISISKGYNAGGFNQQLGTNLGGQLVSYNPEKLTAYEGGLKTEWLDRRLRVNGSVFYQKFEDIQTSLLITFNGVATRQVQTGATAHEEGIELEAEALPTRDLTLHANISYLRQHYDSIAKGVTAFTLATPISTAPKLTYSVDASYVFHLKESSSVVASLNWRAVGKKPACSPVGSCYAPAYGLLGGRLDYHPPGDSPWTLGLFGTNLLGAKAVLGKNVGGGMGVDSYNPGRPTEVGVEVRRTF